MLKIVIAAIILLFTNVACAANKSTTQPSVPEHLRDISVTVSTPEGSGSGVIVVRGHDTYIWTDAHVVDRERHVRNFIDPKTGKRGTRVEFDDVKIVQAIEGNGNEVGRIIYVAEIIRYSNEKTGEDIALLRLRKKDAFKDSAEFYLQDRAPIIGTELYHFGSFHGASGEFSLSEGVLSKSGRYERGRLLDQITCPHVPGSSGGGTFTRDGQCIGLVDLTVNPTWGYITPVRRMKTWATKVGVEFALDPTKPVPDDKTLSLYPVDDDVAEHVEPLKADDDESPVSQFLKRLFR